MGASGRALLFVQPLALKRLVAPLAVVVDLRGNPLGLLLGEVLSGKRAGFDINRNRKVQARARIRRPEGVATGNLPLSIVKFDPENPFSNAR